MTDFTEVSANNRKRTGLLRTMEWLSYLGVVGIVLGLVAVLNGELFGLAAAAGGFSTFLSMQVAVYVIQLLEDIRVAARTSAAASAQHEGSHRKALDALQRIEVLQRAEMIDQDEAASHTGR